MDIVVNRIVSIRSCNFFCLAMQCGSDSLPTVQESVEAEIFVPYTETKISEICMVENGENVAFKEVEGGLCMTVPAGYRRGSAPIALVFEMKKER